MTPDERQLIADLFQRMRDVGAVEKDREAEAFILQLARATPDSAYKLVQSVLVQENALQQADERIRDLEDQLRDMQEQAQPRQASGGGSFLGGLFGGSNTGNRPDAYSQPSGRAGSSVPPIGGRGSPSAYDQPSSNPWGPAAGAPSRGYGEQPQPQRSGGGFMKTAAATAAGVAGGMLLADSFRNMLGGGGHAHAAGGDKSSSEPSPYEVSAKDQNTQQEPHYQNPDDNDPGNYDISDDSSGFGSDDMDI